MDIQALRNHIVDNDLVPRILESLGCQHIKKHGTYYSCANPDGDNESALNVMLPSLYVVDYTRDLDSISKHHDIFTLVQFFNDCNFFEAIQYICECLGLSVYHDFDEDIPESLVLTRELLKMIDDEDYHESEKPLSPIPEQILKYYLPYVNDMFEADNISYETQAFFQVGYDPASNRITIPIRNYNGDLIGVKGRWFGDIPDGSDIQKYIYIERCNKSQVLFGLDKSYNKIEESRFAFVGESEKFVMQLWTYGDQCCVATGGKTISNQQIDLLSRLCDKVVLCFDKDVQEDELVNIANKFLGYVEVYTIVDVNGLLSEKESPSDDPEKWRVLKQQLKQIR